MLKATILSISLLTIMASAAVSPALGAIALALQGTDHTLIKLIITLPSMMIIPFSFISGKLADYLSKKTILYIGLCTYVVGGIAGGFMSDIWTLLAMRAVLGIGVGLVMPVSTALIADFYKGAEAAKMTGWVAAANNLGGIIAVAFSGWLATFSWRYSFFVYLIGLVPFILILFFLPTTEQNRTKTKSDEKLPPVTYLAAISAFLMMTVFYAAPTNLAIFITTNELGNAGTAGLVLAFLTTAGFIAGSVFTRVQGIFKVFMLPVQTVIMGAGFYLLAHSGSMAIMLTSAALIGFSFGNLYPMILLLVIKGVPKAQNVKAMAVVSSFIFFGQFFSPVCFDTIGKVVGNTDIALIFVVAAALLGVATLLFTAKSVNESLLRPAKLQR